MLYLLVYISVIACEQVLGWETREKERLQAESKGRGVGKGRKGNGDEGRERGLLIVPSDIYQQDHYLNVPVHVVVASCQQA